MLHYQSWQANSHTEPAAPGNRRFKLTYEEFKSAYIRAFKSMMSYKPTEVGSGHFAEKMADLADAYPEYAEKVKAEAA